MYGLNDITKLLDKLFKAGFNTDKTILNIQLDDLVKIKDISTLEINILLDLKRAIKNKQIIAFLNGNKERKEDKVNEGI